MEYNSQLYSSIDQIPALTIKNNSNYLDNSKLSLSRYFQPSPTLSSPTPCPHCQEKQRFILNSMTKIKQADVIQDLEDVLTNDLVSVQTMRTQVIIGNALQEKELSRELIQTAIKYKGLLVQMSYLVKYFQQREDGVRARLEDIGEKYVGRLKQLEEQAKEGGRLLNEREERLIQMKSRITGIEKEAQRLILNTLRKMEQNKRLKRMLVQHQIHAKHTKHTKHEP